MWWLKNLYLGESVRGKEKEIKRKLRGKAGFPGVFILSISLQPGEMIDIFPSGQLRQDAFPKEELRVFGLAGDRKEALDMLTDICRETMDATGNADMRSFLDHMEYRKSRSF